MMNRIPRSIMLAVAALTGMTACQKSPEQILNTPGAAKTEQVKAAAAAPICMAFVEVNDNALRDAGCFQMKDGKPVVNVANIFAANINYYTDPVTKKKLPVVKLNAQVTYLLSKTTYVKDLQAKGIKVTLALLNNHDGSGWSSFQNQTEADYFAKSVKKVVDLYKLDGIEIDDEYSGASSKGIATSVGATPMAVAAIRKLLPNILIGHYLFSDEVNPASVLAYKFSDGRKFADMINYALPDYGVNPDNYTGSISKDKLFFSYQASSSSISTGAAKAKSQGYAGVMLFNVNKNSSSGMSQVAKAFYGTGTTVSAASDCFSTWDKATIEKGPETYIVP